MPNLYIELSNLLKSTEDRLGTEQDTNIAKILELRRAEIRNLLSAVASIRLDMMEIASRTHKLSENPLEMGKHTEYLNYLKP